MLAGSLTTMVSTMGALFFDSSAKAGLPFSPLMFTTTGFLDVSSDFVTSDGTVTLSSVYGFSVATCIGALTLEAVSFPHILHFFGQFTLSQSSLQLFSV